MRFSPSFSKEYEVEVGLVDFRGNIKLSALFLCLQDAAVLHGEELGIGRKEMLAKHNGLWVLARMRVDLMRYPAWGERITVETWPNLPGRVECLRNFLVRDAQGEVLAKAVSVWVVIDVETRRLQKAESVFPEALQFISEKAIDAKLGKLRAEGELEPVHKRVVGYSDIDINGHVNNAKYVDFIADCFSLAAHKKHRINSIEVNYSNEALPGETVTLYKDISRLDQGLVYVEGVNAEGDKLIFKAKMGIEPCY